MIHSNRFKSGILIGLASVLLLMTTGQKASAQYYFYDNFSYNSPLMFEFGVSAGAMNCLTDLGGKKGLGKKFLGDLNMGKTQLNGSIYLSATYKEAYTLRLEGTFGQVKAYDSILVNEKLTSSGRYQRNLNFQSKISEISLIAELHPLFAFIDWSLRDDKDPPRLSPYLAAGIGYFSFNPQSKNRRGEWVDLQPLSLEGQGFAEYPDRKTYKLSQFNFPIGLGVRYELSSVFNLRAEVMHRVLNTDYLDDVSTRYIDNTIFSNYFSGSQLQDAVDLASNQRTNIDPANSSWYRKTEGGIRGNPKNNDSYFTFNLKIGYIFGRDKR